MTERPRRVFLSHTSELGEYPQPRSFVEAAEAAVKRAGDATEEMTFFGARNEGPPDLCRDKVRSCDVYVGLIGLRYGSLVPGLQRTSYTEFEFGAATEAGLPRLVFLLDENATLPIPVNRLLESDPALQASQREFRRRLLAATDLTIRKIAHPDQLETELVAALMGSRGTIQAPAVTWPMGVPSAPDLVGRETEVTTLAEALVADPPEWVAVGGGPGMGKSAVCLTALHDDRVVQRFGERRWFVRCEDMKSAADLLSGLATALGVMAPGASGKLLDRVCAVLGAGPSVVVLDSFESPWSAEDLQVEELLRRLAPIRSASIVISVRGVRHPGGTRWRDFTALGSLPLADARRLFLTVAGSRFATDPQLDAVLTPLDGMPLAVELMAYNVQGERTLDDVAGQWQRAGAPPRGDNRATSLAVSIEASIRAPQMTPAARRLLGFLSLLPDGIYRDDLGELLPAGGLQAANVLRQHGLAYETGRRLRALGPIRGHVADAHPLAATDLIRLIDHYAQFAATMGDQVGRVQGAEAAARLSAETGNVVAALQQAAAHSRIGQLVDGVCGMVRYWQFTGLTQAVLITLAERAMRASGTTARQQVRVGLAFGELDLSLSKYPDAAERYRGARESSKWIDDDKRHHEAHCLTGLGGVELALASYSVARGYYEEALPIYRDVGDELGQANCIKGLGNVAWERADYQTAHDQYQRALRLYGQAGDVLGEANCIKSLGDVALAQETPDHAAASRQYEKALPLYCQVGDVLGQANCTSGLGDVARKRSDPAGARVWYRQALRLYQQIGDVLGEASCYASLGETAAGQSDLGSARTHYEQALAKYQVAGDYESAAWMFVSLARIAPSRAKTLWESIQSEWSMAGRNDLVRKHAAEFS